MGKRQVSAICLGCKPFPSKSFKCLRSCHFLRRTAEMLSLERKGHCRRAGGGWALCVQLQEWESLLSTLRSPSIHVAPPPPALFSASSRRPASYDVCRRLPFLSLN